jgi:PPM family protein phosphatase
MRYGQATDAGKVRESNEDGVFSTVMRAEFYNKQLECGVFMVVDGMGGREDGAKAAEMTIQAVAKHVPGKLTESLREESIFEAIKEALLAANHAMMQMESQSRNSSEEPLSRFSGSAVATVAVIVERKALIGHIGDTFAYRITPETCQQITQPHTLAQALLNAGHITREEFEDFAGDKVYRALGCSDDIDIDTYIEPLAEGDHLLLCSDGLSRHVKNEELQQYTLNAPTPQEACNRLVSLANEKSGYDNVSVIVVQV